MGQEWHYKYFIKKKSKVIQIKITNIETSIFKIENVLYLAITVILSMTLLQLIFSLQIGNISGIIFIGVPIGHQYP